MKRIWRRLKKQVNKAKKILILLMIEIKLLNIWIKMLVSMMLVVLIMFAKIWKISLLRLKLNPMNKIFYSNLKINNKLILMI